MRTSNTDALVSERSTVYAPHGVVATSQPLAAEAGLDTLRAGGNAFDAAVATAAALSVVEPVNTGLGGDAFACFRTADGEVGGMRSCGFTPAKATRDRVRALAAEHQGVSPGDASMPFRGPLAVTVPGAAKGWELTVSEFGKLTLADVLQPAIDYATEGFPVTEVIADDWQAASDQFIDANGREQFLKDGRAPRAGEEMRLENLGRSLQRIATHGAEAVYEGEIGQAIAETVQSHGGLLTTEDLAAFEPELVDPASTTYRGAEVFELPPNNQGLIALEALNLAEEVDAGSHRYDAAERVHYFAEALKLAFRDGHHYITDPTFEKSPPLASKTYAAERAKHIGKTALTDVPLGVPQAEHADTVLLAAADAEGNVVTFINSRYKQFGSGLVAGDTGIALQNRGGSFSLSSDNPNCIAPRKRPFHTLIPAIARLGDDDWLGFGVMGGFMQPQGHLQMLSNILDYDHSLQEAVEQPRWRYKANGRLALEEGLAGRVGSRLSSRGHDIEVLPFGAFGGGQLARYDDGTLSAATDPRKDGNAVGF
ncbi:gamma-glutamyltransferase [Haloarcula nitratireducens]|uniref:Gamma-glutamyltransferase n=1 Tax=Haloarcula nitratireducens TaxID=2487749 RepID=A0AAW4PJM7_9EURY|nr:gamma-glutamyltransferase [Halomicroarcula nitratireducens]MBX0297432.1 gamma-glutamyltransferase [Halomicroarcula nitratireducens]